MRPLTVKVPADTAARLDAYSASRGGRSKVLRTLIEGALAQTDDAAAESRPAVEPGLGAKVTIRLKRPDLASLDAEAFEAGLKRTEWIVALIRRRLGRRPGFKRADRMELLAIYRELNRIGVNLNQVARAVNTAVLPGQVLELEMSQIRDFRREVRDLAQALAAAMNGDLSYWDEAAT